MPFAELVPLWHRAEHWLLPGSCLLCEGTVERETDDPLICALCRSRFHRLPHPQCARCGQPFLDPGAAGQGPLSAMGHVPEGTRQSAERGPWSPACRICPQWPEGFERARSAVWLDERSRRAVHHLKYGGWPRVAQSLALTMTGLLEDPAQLVLVPVPLARGRARRRGYNQAERLACAVAAQHRVALEPALLRRARETTTQTRLTPEARAANVGEAFVARDCREARVVLVDDVFTTGATLVAAATALLEAGAAAVEAITFARARPPLG
jgi:ComF family protein